MLAGPLVALQFLTRLPVRTRQAPDLTRSVPWFPMIGALLGLLLGAMLLGLSELVPVTVAAALVVLIGVLLTGAFHEDGLADVADAFAGGWDREQRLRILRDPLHGSYGVAAMSGSIVLRIVCLATLVPAVGAAALLAAHTLARGAAVGAMAVFPTARPDGLGADYTRSLRPTAASVGVFAALVVGAIATGWWVLPLAASAGIGAVAMGVLAVRKIGGVTGDVLGAIEQIAECLVLVTVTGLAARHDLWWR